MALDGGRHVDRILDAPVVRGAGPIGTRIGVADDGAGTLGHQIRIAAQHQRVQTPGHFGLVRRLDLERRRAVFDRMRIDARDRRDVARRDWTDADRGHGGVDDAKKTPREGNSRGAKMRAVASLSGGRP